MRKGFLWAVVLMATLVGPLGAQLPFNRLPPEGCEPDYHAWGRVDYMLWWLKPAPLPVPLVATNAADIVSLDTPGTTVLYGQNVQDFGAFNGGRIVAGFWIDPEGALGFEASGFLTQQRSGGFSFASDAAGNPSTFVPFRNPTTDTETGVIISSTGVGSGTLGTGTININNTIRFWGYNGDALLTVIRTPGWEVNMIGGFRYLDLLENFDLAKFSDFPTIGSVLRNDSFQTRNQFYGGEIGLRARLTCPVVFVEMAGKIAFGVNHQQANISGQTTTDTTVSGGGITTIPGGIFAQLSNGGTHNQAVFAIAPEAQVRVGLEVSSHLKLSLGYDFIYMNHALRPGNQIDRVADLNQAIARPAFSFNSSEFFAHGVSLGLELRY